MINRKNFKHKKGRKEFVKPLRESQKQLLLIRPFQIHME